MTYRSDLAALEARKAALDAELARKQHERDETARLLDEARVLASAEASFARQDNARFQHALSIWSTRISVAFLIVFCAALSHRALMRPLQRTMLLEDVVTTHVHDTLKRLGDGVCSCPDAKCILRLGTDLHGVFDKASHWNAVATFSSRNEQIVSDDVTRILQCVPAEVMEPFWDAMTGIQSTH